MKISADFSSETVEPTEQWYIQSSWSVKRIEYPVKIFFRKEGDKKTFSGDKNQWIAWQIFCTIDTKISASGWGEMMLEYLDLQ